MESFPKISISSINCNSLNMSSIGNTNHLLKIYGIVSLQSDIILLSDVRLCNAMGISNSAELTVPLGRIRIVHMICSYNLLAINEELEF